MNQVTTENGVEVPAVVREQIEQVRQSGAVNMTSANGVQEVAESMGFYALVDFIEDHRDNTNSRRRMMIWVDVLNACYPQEN